MAIYSLRLDESGTDGQSPFVLVGGCVASISQWERVEEEWEKLLGHSSLSSFHWKEYKHKEKEFGGWSRFKHRRFADKIEKIINRNTLFRVSAAIDSEKHKEIKERMRGIKGFHHDSDFALCLRVLMFSACEQLSKIDSNCQLHVMVEMGPWSKAAEQVFRKVSHMTGRWKPAKHAHRLIGFKSHPKGEFRSLELADYVAGTELESVQANQNSRGNTLQFILNDENLEYWYRGMIKEKELRKKYGSRKTKKITKTC